MADTTAELLARERLIEDTVRFVLRHYEQLTFGETVFTPVEVDPDEWWAKMTLQPRNLEKMREASRKHFFKMEDRWIELAKVELIKQKDQKEEQT